MLSVYIYTMSCQSQVPRQVDGFFAILNSEMKAAASVSVFLGYHKATKMKYKARKSIKQQARRGETKQKYIAFLWPLGQQKGPCYYY